MERQGCGSVLMGKKHPEQSLGLMSARAAFDEFIFMPRKKEAGNVVPGSESRGLKAGGERRRIVPKSNVQFGGD